MAEIIIMPKLGFNMSEGKLVKWYKNEGDPVKKGENLFSIETDKTNMDIEATADGIVLKLFIEEGDSLPVTMPIAIIGAAGENIDALTKEAESKLGISKTKENTVADITESFNDNACEDHHMPSVTSDREKDGIIMISPRAKRVASENNVKIDGIVGTGFNGGICENDIIDYLSAHKIKATPLASAVARSEDVDLSGINGTGEGGKIMKSDVINATAKQDEISAACEDGYKKTADGRMILEEIPYTGVRKIIGDRLAHSKFTAPHLYFTQKVNMEDVLKLRKQVNNEQDFKTSVTDYISKAVIIALEKFPEMNSSLVDGTTLIRYKSVNLGIAVASDKGLIVPNIKDAQDMSVIEISKQSKPLFEKAREGKLTPDEYSCGTFTVSNLGMFGIENFTGIINPPEVGILTISSTKDEPFVVTKDDGSKEIAIKPMMNITVSVDHRVIDGLLASQFVTEVKRLLEHPISLMI